MLYEEVFRKLDDKNGMNNIPRRKAPFSFRLSKEKLKEFHGLSAEAKLQWLEEANMFVNEFVSPEKLRKWEELK
jgi:hypothetical protein